MKLWLSRNSEIPLRDQLTRQVMAAVASGDLKVGDKLPSVRELALRFDIHQNTVSNAYQWLEENGWVEARKGSGVFVRELSKNNHHEPEHSPETELAILLEHFMLRARQLGFSEHETKEHLAGFLAKPGPGKIVIVESNPDLQKILHAELIEHIETEVAVIQPDQSAAISSGSLVVAMPETAESIREILPADAELMPVRISSAQMEMKNESKPSPDSLIGIVSGWEMFRRWAKTFLLAAGIDGDSLLVRDTAEEGFQKGLGSCTLVIADSVAAREIQSSNVRIFRIISEEFVTALREKLG